MKVKAGREVIECVKLCYAADKPCLLTGVHGSGKTALLEQSATELGIGFITLDLSLLESVDLQGIPSVKDDRTVYHPPAILPKDGRGLFSLEEMNRADRSVLAPSLLLLSSRRLNSYELPRGWLPVGSINPSDGYDVNELDPALVSRFVRIEVTPDVKTWLEWGRTAGIHHAVLQYVGQAADIFASSDSNPRSWYYVSDVLKSHEQNGGGNEGRLTAVVSGIVGDALGVGFVTSYLNGETPIPGESILTRYDHFRGTVQDWTKAKRTDLVRSTARLVMVALQDTDTAARVAKSEVEKTNLGNFLSDIPADISRQVARAAKQAGVLN